MHPMSPLMKEDAVYTADLGTRIERIAPMVSRQVYLLSPGDVHLGAHNRSGAFLEILLNITCDMLVLNGDFLETNSLEYLIRHLTQNDRDLLRLIDKKWRTGMRVVYTQGNHDDTVQTLLEDIQNLLQEGVYVRGSDEYDALEALSYIGNWEIQEMLLHEYRGKKFVHIHGDQWDHIVRGQRVGRFIASLGSFFWDLLKRVDREKHTVASFTKRRVKLWTKVSNQVAVGAIALAKQYGAEYAFAGHTHDPWEFSIDGVNYINAGSFDMYESGMVSIELDGTVLLHRVHARSTHINPYRQNIQTPYSIGQMLRMPYTRAYIRRLWE